MSHADILDEAAEREQQLIEVALANRPKPEVEFIGKCHWCEESIAKGSYCNADCRHDHEVYIRAQQQRRIA